MRLLFRKIRFYFRLIKEFWLRQKKAIVLSLFITLSAILLFSLSPFFPGKVGVEKIGLVGKYSLSDIPLDIQDLISRGLTLCTPDGTPQPSLAASWEITDEGKKYLFTLKGDLFWQDGDQLTSQDINYNFTDVAINRPNSNQIEFTLKEAFSPFPVIVSKPVFKKGLIGNGEYSVKKIEKKGQIIERIVLKPKDKSKPVFDYRFYPTESAAKTAFKLGEVDILKDIVNPGELSEWPNSKTDKQTKENRFVALFFNTEDPVFGEKSLRQAFAYAVKDHWENDALNSINPLSWAYNPNVKPYNFDLENAKKLKKGAEEKGIAIDKITLSTIPSLLSSAELIQADWADLGVETKIKIINNVSEQFQVLLVSQEIPPDPDQYILWHSTQTTNITSYKSPKLDKLLEDGRRTSDQAERKKIYQDFQRFLVEDAPAIFLFHPTVYTISRT